jgi:hypothetical protein
MRSSNLAVALMLGLSKHGGVALRYATWPAAQPEAQAHWKL